MVLDRLSYLHIKKSEGHLYPSGIESESSTMEPTSVLLDAEGLSILSGVDALLSSIKHITKMSVPAIYFFIIFACLTSLNVCLRGVQNA